MSLRDCEEGALFQRANGESETYTLMTPATTSNLMKEFVQEIGSPVTRICNIRLRVVTYIVRQLQFNCLIMWANELIQLI